MLTTTNSKILCRHQFLLIAHAILRIGNTDETLKQSKEKNLSETCNIYFNTNVQCDIKTSKHYEPPRKTDHEFVNKTMLSMGNPPDDNQQQFPVSVSNNY